MSVEKVHAPLYERRYAKYIALCEMLDGIRKEVTGVS